MSSSQEQETSRARTYNDKRFLQLVPPEESDVTASPTPADPANIPAEPIATSPPTAGGDVGGATPSPTTQGTSENDSTTTNSVCECSTCDQTIWDSVTDSGTNITCGDRIEFVMGEGNSELEACTRVAEEFPDICGACNPATCVDEGTDPEDGDGDSMANNGTIVDLPETNVTDIDDGNTTIPGNTDPEDDELVCGCVTCTWSVLETVIEGDATCVDRLNFLLEQGIEEQDACVSLSEQFPDQCGLCNPLTCSLDTEDGTATLAPGNETLVDDEDETVDDNEAGTGIPTISPTALDILSDVPSLVPTNLDSAASLMPSEAFPEITSMPVQDNSGAFMVMSVQSMLCSVSTTLLVVVMLVW